MWALVNLTSLKDNKKMKELIDFGLFDALMNMLEDGNSQIECLEKVELSLIVLCNAIADQDKFKIELLNIEQVRGQCRLTIKEKIDFIINELEKQSSTYEFKKYQELLTQTCLFIQSYLHAYEILTKK